jgi:hypothetical protein
VIGKAKAKAVQVPVEKKRLQDEVSLKGIERIIWSCNFSPLSAMRG